MLKKEYKTRELTGDLESKNTLLSYIQKTDVLCYIYYEVETLVDHSMRTIYTHYLYVFRRTSQIKHQFYVHIRKKVHSECC